MMRERENTGVILPKDGCVCVCIYIFSWCVCVCVCVYIKYIITIIN